MNKKIPLFPLVLLIVTAIDSIRTLPSTAFFGSSLIFFYLVASIMFLIPVALVSAEFSSRFPDHGGIFHWIRLSFGNRMGLLATWLQWINTMVWYPTMLVFITGTAAYLMNPLLAYQPMFLLIASLLTFWVLTLLNLKGIQMSVRLSSICGLVGTLLPMCFLIVLGIGWAISSDSLAIDFSWESLLPSFNLIENSGAVVTIMASFLGMELAGVHINDIDHPQKNFPKAIGYSVLVLLGTLVLGSLAVAVVIPQEDIHFVDGIMQTFTKFFVAFDLPYLIPMLAFLIVIGSSGGSINWLLSPAKGLMQAAEFGFLPPFFLVKNKHGVPFRILIAQGILVSIFCTCLQFVQSINTYYWFLMSLSTGLYMLMYVLLFLAALKLGRPEKGYKIPVGIRKVSCFAGLCACIITIIIGCQPPANWVLDNKIGYVSLIVGGFILMALPAGLFWIYQNKRQLSNI